VILTKDHTKWNLDVLQDVIEGPLLNHKRIEEAIKVSKFMRKLMSFFHPFSHRFADMPRRVSTSLWSLILPSYDVGQCALGKTRTHTSEHPARKP
jgi:rapamycin-insensitive companion of mTOR